MTRPSNDAIAQAFWEWLNRVGPIEAAFGEGERPGEIEQRAREIDAAKPAANHGAAMLSAPTGRPARAWTEDEREALRVAMKELAEDEASMADDSQCVMVPREPTKEMLVAAERSMNSFDEGGAYWHRGYQAMLAIAPTPPKQEAIGEVVQSSGMRRIEWTCGATPTVGTKLYATQPEARNDSSQPAPTTDDTRDAERYRWLRDRASKDEGNIVFELAGAYDDFGMSEEGIDSAIDAAIREASGESSDAK